MGNPFRILSLDGGGIRGLFAAACLARIEEITGKRIEDYFDLICGTSTGAIIAAALARGVRPRTISDFYREKGAAIFTRSAWKPIGWMQRWATGRLARRLLRGRLNQPSDLFQCKYDGQPLHTALESVFAQSRLLECKKRLIIPTIDLVNGRVSVMKTPHLPGMVRDPQRRIVDVLRATTAAPTYFPAHEVDCASFCDGGLWANHPALLGYIEAIRIKKENSAHPAYWNFEESDIAVLSIGTGERQYSERPPDKAGLAWWGPRVVELIGDSQSQAVDFQLKFLLGDRHLRLNFALTKAEMKLDSFALLNDYAARGRDVAEHRFAEVENQFLKSTAKPAYWWADKLAVEPLS